MAKVVIITGGSTGIGKSIATSLHSKGMKVYGTSRNPEKPEYQTLPYLLLKMDVNDTDSVNTAIKDVLDKEGRIDVLVNNAGIGMVGSVEDTSLEEFRGVFETNLFGTIRTIQAVLPSMRAQKSGTIINISSLAGLMGLPYRSAYCASKAGIEAITEALSMEVKPFNIKVVVIEPGDFSTTINDNRETAIKARDRNSVYYDTFSRINNQIIEEVNTAASPEVFGPLIYELIESSSPGLRYKVGSAMQKLSVKIKNLIPPRTFEKILLNHYKM